MKSLHNKSFKTMLDYTPEEIKYYLELAGKLKADKKAGKEIKTMEGKILCSSLKRILRERVVPLKSVRPTKGLIQHTLVLQVLK